MSCVKYQYLDDEDVDGNLVEDDDWYNSDFNSSDEHSNRILQLLFEWLQYMKHARYELPDEVERWHFEAVVSVQARSRARDWLWYRPVPSMTAVRRREEVGRDSARGRFATSTEQASAAAL